MSRETRLLLLGLALGFVAGWVIVMHTASFLMPKDAVVFEPSLQTVSVKYTDSPESARKLRSAPPLVTNPVHEIPRTGLLVHVPSVEEEIQLHQAAIKQLRSEYALKEESVKALETKALSMVRDAGLSEEEVLRTLDRIETDGAAQHDSSNPVPTALEQTLRDWRTGLRIRESIYLRILQETVDMQGKTNLSVGQ